MRIEVVDPGGHGLGLAIGLLELGHDVRYRCDVDPPAADGRRFRMEVVERMFGGVAVDDGGSDLLVLVDTFADWLHALECGYEQPGQDVARYPERLRDCCRRIAAAERVVVLDMSDRAAPREVAFAGLPNVTCFAREVGDGDGGAWQPFPFLYNLAMLWLEHCQRESDWLVAGTRATRWDWAFCGTVDHERYGMRRRVALHLIAERHPRLRGVVLGRRSFREVVGALQQVRLGLDLPGVGELCFRLHECLALGTSVWQPLATRLALPPGLEPVVGREPDGLPPLAPTEVRAIYREHYGPRAAARWLLERVSGQYPVSQATNIAPAASR